MEDEELSLEELDNVIGGVERKVAIDKALGQPNDSYRNKMIKELKHEKEALKTFMEEEPTKTNRR